MRYFLVLIYGNDGWGKPKAWMRVWTFKDRKSCEIYTRDGWCVILCELTEEEAEGYPVA